MPDRRSANEIGTSLKQALAEEIDEESDPVHSAQIAIEKHPG
jgi:hypothetical protein